MQIQSSAGIHVARVAAAVLCLALFPRTSVAFKIDTHVWIAQQVLNDAVDGFIEVRLAPQGKRPAETVRIAVPPEVRRALGRFPEFFRMGSIGPDAFPDVLVGQMIIHPSVAGGWGTADWLRHLHSASISDEQRAFAFGYLIHAAADVFAHTYVNRYAGDVFELKKPAASIRHVRLESFISQFTPDLADRNGRSIGKASSHLRSADGQLAVPVDFTRDLLYFNESAVAELDRSGKAPHIPHIRTLRGRLSDALANGGFVDNLEVLAIRIALKATLDIELSEEDAKRVREWSEKIHNIGDFSEESMQFMNQIDQSFKDVHVFTRDQLNGFFIAANSAIDAVRQARKDIQDKKKSIDDKKKQIQNEVDEFIENKCEDACGSCPAISIGCRVTCKTVCSTVKRVNEVKRQLKADVARLEREVSTLADGELERVKRVHTAIISALDVITKAIDEKLRLNRIALEYFSKDQAKSPLRRILQNWHDDINTAMSAFVTANGEAMAGTITAGVEKPLTPYKAWFDCYAKGIVGVPILITNGICSIEQGVEDFRGELKRLEDNIANLTQPTKELNDVKKQIEASVQQLKDEIIAQGTDVIADELGKLIDVDLLLWKQVFTTPTSADELNAEFNSDRHNDGLLLIPDIAERVRAEMHIGKDGTFDSRQFAPVANAIALAKLALLDAGGLRELARRSGVVDSIFGEYLYDGDQPEARNILFGFAKSIDGNHQWHRLAPPHPRQTGFDEMEFLGRRDNPLVGFTYVDDRCEPVRGMRQWLDPLARPLLFERLFIGPLVAGVDLPYSLTPPFKSVLPANYPNTVTRQLPWGLDGAELGIARMSRSVEIRGRGAKGLNVSLSRKGQELGNGQVDDSGHWHFRADLSLTRSEWLLITYRDTAGKAIGELSTTYCSKTEQDGQAIQSYVTVVKSHSLWKIAELMTGNPENYISLYHKNRHLIADQDLIYPGQILLVPGDDEWKFK
jgi:hypothetical protein